MTRRWTFWALTPAVVLLALVASPARAQDSTGTVVGKVVSSRDGRSVDGVRIRLPRLDIEVLTDSAGNFLLQNVPPGSHRIIFERIGFLASDGDMDLGEPAEVWDVGTIILEPLPVQMGAIDIEVSAEEARLPQLARHGFFERRASGLGNFATVEQIESWHPRQFSDIMRHIGGFRVMPNGNYGRPIPPRTTEFGIPVSQSPGRDTRRFIITSSRQRAHCPPLIYVDLVHIGDALTFNMNLISPHMVAGVEAYSGSAQVPAAFNRAGAQCGVIVIWTK